MRVYIFGAGRNGRLLVPLLRIYDIEVIAFIDNDKNKWNKKYDEIECIDPDRAFEVAKEEIVLISISDYAEVEQQLLNKGFQFVWSVNAFFRKLNYFVPRRINTNDYAKVKPFNYYESPYPDVAPIYLKEECLFQEDKMIAGIDFNLSRQFSLLETFKKIQLLPWESHMTENLRYYYDNGWFSKGCAHALYYMLYTLRPKRIIEVGSGFSTAVMLDVNDRSLDNNMGIICVEPNPQRLKSVLRPTDNLCIYEKELQDITLDFFEDLDENDILFIDSSHVAKFNSDVNYIFFEILPRLKSGVYIHFHDIFYPFVYPKKWICEGRPYSEMYVLRAFLMHNSQYKIELFPDLLVKTGNREAAELFDSIDNYSIWIKKQ